MIKTDPSLSSHPISQEWIRDVVEKAKGLHVNGGLEPGADLGPLVSKEAKRRVLDLIQSGVDEGAVLELDGRGVTVPKYPNGNFVGPTVLNGVTASMKCVALI